MKKTKGITLIALIITIVVLLILAVVAINAVQDGGIIAHAKDAQTSYNEAQINEQATLEQYKQFLNNEGEIRPGIAVGDYINYEPDPASPYQATSLADTITGSTSNTTDIYQEPNIKWQVLKINNDGSMDLIGRPTQTSNKITFKGALGYNNGVYVLNDICKSLYSKSSKGITARSVNIDDFEYWLRESDKGVEARDNCISGEYMYGETNFTYTGEYSHRPDIFGKTNNESDSFYPNPTTNTYSGGGDTDTLVVKQTNYNIDINEKNYGKGAKVLNNNGNKSYWVASRVVFPLEGVVCFGLRDAYNSFGNTDLFCSIDDSTLYGSNSFCPVVSLGFDVQISASGTASSSSGTPHTIIWE